MPPRVRTNRKTPASPAGVLDRLHDICLAFPDAKLTIKWGKPHFVVRERIFAGCGEGDGRAALGMKLTRPHAADLVAKDPRFRPAPYVGKHGWVEMDASGAVDWEQVRELVAESYALIAPKASGIRPNRRRPTPPRTRRPRAR